MAGDDNVFGSNELTPELLRSAPLTERDGSFDAAEVRTFLEMIASSLEVLTSTDAATALRAEFARNAQIAQQVLDAGQDASQQLRRHAAEEASQILEEARTAALQLAASVESEIDEARTQVEQMRATFMQDLRDLYDRIGASLYRFERAAEAGERIVPIIDPSAVASASAPASQPAPSEPQAPADPDLRPQSDVDGEQGLTSDVPPAGDATQPPAWQQLPAEAWASSTTPHETAEAPLESGAAASEGPPAAFQVEEDEPLAPGEPLVDLRGFQEAVADIPVTPDPAAGDLATDASTAPEASGDPSPEPALDAVFQAPAPGSAPDDPPPAETAETAPETAGSWLDAPSDQPAAPAPEASPLLAHDDALAEALIAGDPFDEAQAGSAPAAASAADPAGPPVPVPGIPGQAPVASPDAVMVRQLILESLAAGQTRESVETYLRDQMGMLEPGALIDAALNAPPETA